VADAVKEIRILSNHKELDAAMKNTDEWLAHLSENNDTTCTYYYQLKALKGLIYIRKDMMGDALLVFEELVNKLENTRYQNVTCNAYLSLALIHEFMGRPEACLTNLKKARELIIKYGIPDVKTRYHVRYASYARLFLANLDSCRYHTEKALEFVEYTPELNDVGDAYMLMAACSKTKAEKEKYRSLAIDTYARAEDMIASMFLSFGVYNDLLKTGNLIKAENYLDSIKIKYLDVIQESSLEKSLGLSMYYKKKKEIYVGRKDYIKALECEELYGKNVEAYNTAKNQSNLTKLQDEFLYEKEQRKSKELEKQTTLYRNILLLSLIFMFVLAILLYRNYHQKQKIKIQKDIIESSMIEVQNLNFKNEILLSEMHHRIKNSLQNIIGIMQIQKGRIQNDEMRQILSDLSHRINCISLIHEQLHQNQNNNLIHLSTFIHTLIELLHQMSDLDKTWYSKIMIDPQLSVNNETAMPLGIIINELVINSLKHAKTPLSEKLEIALSITQSDESFYVFSYTDNGLQPTPDTAGKGMGMMLIRSMIKQLNTHIDESGSSGTGVNFKFKLKEVAMV
jgi:two-component sensor histidine kinase